MKDDDLLLYLDTLSNDDLERLLKMLNIKEFLEVSNKNAIEIEKLKAETKKLQQDTKYFVFINALSIAVILFVLNLLAKKLGFM